jgi:hypothetical protein
LHTKYSSPWPEPEVCCPFKINDPVLFRSKPYQQWTHHPRLAAYCPRAQSPRLEQFQQFEQFTNFILREFFHQHTNINPVLVLSFMSQWGSPITDKETQKLKRTNQLPNASLSPNPDWPASASAASASATTRSPSPTPDHQRTTSRLTKSRPTSMVQTFHPPLMEVAQEAVPELQPVFAFINSHSSKLYQEGYFLKLHDLDSRTSPWLFICSTVFHQAMANKSRRTAERRQKLARMLFPACRHRPVRVGCGRA